MGELVVPEFKATLLGRWRSDPTDRKSVELYGDVSLEFTERGELIYTVQAPDKDQVMLLRYQLEGDVIVTDLTCPPKTVPV